MLIYFYVPVSIDLVKFFIGRDDLSYPLAVKADFVIFDPKASGINFIVYTILSRIYMNFFLMEFCIMDLFLVTLFFYVGSYMGERS